MALLDTQETGLVWQEKSRLLSLRIPESMAQALEKRAQERGVSVSETVRYALFLFFSAQLVEEQVEQAEQSSSNYIERLSKLYEVLEAGLEASKTSLEYLVDKKKKLELLEQALEQATKKQSERGET